MRTRLIKNYLTEQEVYEVIGHHILVFIKIFAWNALILVLLAVVHWLIISQVSSHPLTTRIMGGIGVVIYAKGLYEFIDRYLDALVITNMGLLLFKRNGLFSYKTTAMQWVSIETITDQQDSFADSIFKKGDITIRLEEELHLFKNVAQPAQKVASIITWKERILGTRSAYENEVDESAKDKYELLVEALGEVVSEYVEKKDRPH